MPRATWNRSGISRGRRARCLSARKRIDTPVFADRRHDDRRHVHMRGIANRAQHREGNFRLGCHFSRALTFHIHNQAAGLFVNRAFIFRRRHKGFRTPHSAMQRLRQFLRERYCSMRCRNAMTPRTDITCVPMMSAPMGCSGINPPATPKLTSRVAPLSISSRAKSARFARPRGGASNGAPLIRRAIFASDSRPQRIPSISDARWQETGIRK